MVHSVSNLIVFRLLSVQYVLYLHGYFKEWRKNPRWSFSCCLALLLPLNDLQGEIHGMAGTNIVETQLQSGEFELTTVGSAVKDSGIIDVALEDDEQGDDDTVEVQDDGCQGSKRNNSKCHQGSQTELLSLFTANESRKVTESARDIYL